MRTYQRLSLFGLGLVLLFLASLAIACRAAPPLPSPPAVSAGTPTAGPTNLVLWHSASGAVRSEIEAMARDFHVAYPNETLIPVYAGDAGEMMKKASAAIALGQAPDLILASHDDLARLAAQEGLEPLDGLIADPGFGLSADDQADIFPGVLDEGRFVEFNNTSYALPLTLEGLVLFYNQNMLTTASAQPPTNWDDFANIALKTTKDDQVGWAMSLDADVFAGMLASRGSAMVDRPQKRALFGERGGLATMTLAAQLYKSGAADKRPGRGRALHDFATGKAAFYFDWMSALPTIDAAMRNAGRNFPFGMINLPQADPAEPYMLVRGVDLALLRHSPDRVQHAWFALRWLTASAQTARLAAATYSIPLRASALSLLSQNEAVGSRITQIKSSLGDRPPSFVIYPSGRKIDAVQQLMQDAWDKCLADKADLGAILSNAAKNANAALAGSR